MPNVALFRGTGGAKSIHRTANTREEVEDQVLNGGVGNRRETERDLGRRSAALPNNACRARRRGELSLERRLGPSSCLARCVEAASLVGLSGVQVVIRASRATRANELVERVVLEAHVALALAGS